MITIIGLGNPGEKFENTRHNAGFMAVDFFAKKNDFPDFELEKKFESLISQKEYSGILQNTRISNGKKIEKVLLVKPETFMNKSGLAVKKILSKTAKGNFIVIQDDIDLPLGKIKIVKNRGSAGHKGIESIIKSIGNKNLARIRVGINPKKKKPKEPESFVVKNFTKDEQVIMKKVSKKISEALECFIKEGLEKMMNEYNR